ncbi:MAG TPA: hypothetical protein PKW76_17265 [bacterium]|nr:hypothetical protein [bacterium]HPM99759.1 hypothetical protein [bacterium]
MNFWHAIDEEGIIYSLRAVACIEEGNGNNKLEFLKHRAKLDYLIAKPFQIPECFHMVVGTRIQKKILTFHISYLPCLDSPIALFENAIQSLEKRFPGQSKFKIAKNPLCCTAPLMQNQEGIIEPRFARQK